MILYKNLSRSVIRGTIPIQRHCSIFLTKKKEGFFLICLMIETIVVRKSYNSTLEVMITCIVKTGFKVDPDGLPWESSYLGTHPQSGLFICILHLYSLPILSKCLWKLKRRDYYKIYLNKTYEL